MNATMMQMLLKSLGVNAEDIEKQINVFATNAKIACETLVRMESKIDLLLNEKGIDYGTSERKQLTSANGKSN